MKEIKHVAVYLRKSRNNEGEESEETLHNHRKRLIDVATKNKWTYELFQEVGSSMDGSRSQYTKMIDKIKDSFFDAVLSVNLARVTRDDAETPRFMSLLRNEDVYFVTDSERTYDLEVQEDWQALKFTGFVNNWEYENIKAQLRKGKKDSAKMGRWSNGKPNYGYVYNRYTKELEIEEEKAEAVKLAFQMVIDGVGVDNVAIQLNQLGYRSNNGNLFHGTTVQRMIRAELYKGWIISNRLKGRNLAEGKLRNKDQWIVVKDAVNPCIIDEDTWDFANQRLDERKQLSPRGKQRKHGLSNLIKCGICGKSHAVSERKDRKNTKVLQPCNKKNLLGESCNNRGLNYNSMMELIIESIKDKRNEVILALENSTVENPIFETKTIKIRQIETRIRKLENDVLKNIQVLFEEGDLNLEDYRERKRERTIELSTLQTQLEELEDTTVEDEVNSKESSLQRMEVFLNDWKQLDDTQLNHGLSSFIAKVIWHYPKGSSETPRMEIEWIE